METIVKDKRFAHIANDPRFKTIPRHQKRVKIDKRFQDMFTDKKFKVKYSVDKRGRPTTTTSNEDLQRFYAFSSSDSSDSEEEEEKKSSLPKQSGLKLSRTTSSDDSVQEEDDGNDAQRSDDEVITEKLKSKLRDLSVDYARGEGEFLSGSSSDEESSEDDGGTGIEHGWGELDKEADTTDEITNRLAVCNMDWDRIRAVDIMVLLNSFAPPGGLVHSVTIYPSQFGQERMKMEEAEGPQELIKMKAKLSKRDTRENDENLSSDDDIEDGGRLLLDKEIEEGTIQQMEKIRQYQLNRLKYYYAVVECDSPSTANHIYNECDGMEYESSATRLDLRFVPDDTTFEEDPRERCSEMPDSTKYRPRTFTTTALQQGKVDLTWDETDPTRAELTDRLMAGDTVDDNDLRTYLASSSSDEDNDEKQKLKPNTSKSSETLTTNSDDAVSSSSGDEDDSITKYRSLLAGIDEEHKKKDKDVHMEISWDLGLKEKTEEAVKKHMSSLQIRTPFQEMMEKRKEKRKEKKKQKEKSASSECDKNSLFSDDEVPSDVDMSDPFFADELKNNSKSKKIQRGKSDMDSTEVEADEGSKKAELELLLMDENSSKHFNFKKVQSQESFSAKKKKLKKLSSSAIKCMENDNFQVDVEDSRFSSLYSSHLYNIDPTDPHFKRSRGMDELIAAKQKRLLEQPEGGSVEDKQQLSKRVKKDPELSALVKSIKIKTRNLRK